MPAFSESEITKRIDSGRIIVVVNDIVYDVTEFADRHPGGIEYLKEHAGQDITHAMQNESLHIHSPAAYNILSKYKIGSVSKSQVNGVKHRKVNGKVKNGDLKNGHIQNGHVKNGHVKNGHVKNGSIVTNGLKSVEDFDLADTEMEDLVDWNKPMLGQVMGLGGKYFEWVHQPVDKHIRLFHSDFCEYFSQCPWYVILVVWVPLAVGFLVCSTLKLQDSSIVWPQNSEYSIEFTAAHVPWLFLIGVVMWTWLEYVIHRWLFHLRPPSNIPFLLLAHFLLHGQHHKTPMDKMRLVFPPVPGIMLGLTIYYIYAFFAPHALLMGLFSGTICGYLAYDLTHYYLHHGQPLLPYFRSLKSYHVKHHFVNQSLGFGISSKFWDYPFGTVPSD